MFIVTVSKETRRANTPADGKVQFSVKVAEATSDFLLHVVSAREGKRLAGDSQTVRVCVCVCSCSTRQAVRAQ